MSHMDLGSYYRLMFSLHRHHNYAMAEVEEMLPFERDIYIDMLLEAIKEEKEAQSRQQ